MNINLKELADKSGKTEVEIARTILTVLAIKAEETGRTQTVRLRFCPSEQVIKRIKNAVE